MSGRRKTTAAGVSKRRRFVRVSLPLDMVQLAERELGKLFREAVPPGFRFTRDTFATILFQHGWFDLAEDYTAGKGKDRKVLRGPRPEKVYGVVRSYLVSLLEPPDGEPIYDTRRPRRRRARRAVP